MVSQSQQGQYFPLCVNRAKLCGTSTDPAQDHVHLEYEPQASTVSTLVYFRFASHQGTNQQKKATPLQSQTEQNIYRKHR